MNRTLSSRWRVVHGALRSRPGRSWRPALLLAGALLAAAGASPVEAQLGRVVPGVVRPIMDSGIRITESQRQRLLIKPTLTIDPSRRRGAATGLSSDSERRLVLAVHGDGAAYLWDLERGVRIDGGFSDVLSGTVRRAGLLDRNHDRAQGRLGKVDAPRRPAAHPRGRDRRFRRRRRTGCCGGRHRDGLSNPGRSMARHGDEGPACSPARCGEGGRGRFSLPTDPPSCIARPAVLLSRGVSTGRGCGSWARSMAASAEPVLPRRSSHRTGRFWCSETRGGVFAYGRLPATTRRGGSSPGRNGWMALSKFSR